MGGWLDKLKSPEEIREEQDQKAKGKQWWHWFDPDDTPEERRLLIKLDILILVYAFAAFWCSQLDSYNIANAYVSGMSDKFGWDGNQLVTLQTMYNVGSSVFQLPFIWIFPRVRMNITIPVLNFAYGIITLAQAWTNNYATIIAFRFLIGALEGCFFPAVHWVLGAWYKKSEIARRGGIFYVGLELGALTSGLLQAAALDNLGGKNGLAGWQWMFITSSVATFPIAIWGALSWPGTPARHWTPWLTKEEIELAKLRLRRENHAIKADDFSKEKFIKVFKGWKVYALSFWDVLFWNVTPNTSIYLLWLKTIMPENIPRANNLSSTASGIAIFYVLFCNFLSDWTHPVVGVTLSNVLLLIGELILAVNTQSRAGRYIAYNLLTASYAQSSSLYGWSNHILRRDQEERVIVIMVMNTLAQASTAFVNILTYPNTDSPRYLKGLWFSTAVTITQIIWTQVIAYLTVRDDATYAKADENARITVDAERKALGLGVEREEKSDAKTSPPDSVKSSPESSSTTLPELAERV
ncbi:MFS general substrate transporter [Pseudohyphozyma bogoriensis]|nr:MFS general substrate transporter [Pseudohyphozyma bogoriensis]